MIVSVVIFLGALLQAGLVGRALANFVPAVGVNIALAAAAAAVLVFAVFGRRSNEPHVFLIFAGFFLTARLIEILLCIPRFDLSAARIAGYALANVVGAHLVVTAVVFMVGRYVCAVAAAACGLAYSLFVLSHLATGTPNGAWSGVPFFVAVAGIIVAVRGIVFELDRNRSLVLRYQGAMAQLQTAVDRAISAEKQAAASSVAASVLHEIGNHLNVVHGNLEYLRDATRPDKKSAFAPVFRDLDVGLSRVRTELTQLRTITSNSMPAPELVDVSSLLRELAASYDAEHRAGIRIQSDIDDCLRVRAHPSDLYTVFSSVLLTVGQSVRHRGRLRVRLSAAEGRVVFTCEAVTRGSARRRGRGWARAAQAGHAAMRGAGRSEAGRSMPRREEPVNGQSGRTAVVARGGPQVRHPGAPAESFSLSFVGAIVQNYGGEMEIETGGQRVRLEFVEP